MKLQTMRARAPGRSKPGRAARETRAAFVLSESAQADSEPQDSLPSGERRPMRTPRLLGECRPERRPACEPVGRPRYAADEGRS